MRRRLAVWLVGSAMLAATVALVGCAVTATVAPIVAIPHVTFATGTACDASDCHTTKTHKEPYLGACEKCHGLESWTRVTYKHKDASFDNGMHPLVGCAKCHTEGAAPAEGAAASAAGTTTAAVGAVTPPRGCATCHEAPHKGWQSCGSCHTTFAWRMFNKLPDGHVGLDGGHAKLACLDCHTAKTEPATARQCVACHGSNHGGLTTCQDCHAPATGWKPKPGWSHSDFFVIQGAHTKLECAQCHIDNRFAGTPKVCVGCHGKQHGGLTDCGACHNRTAFKPPTFKHSSVFTLTGAHTKLKCSRCHPDRAFGRNISSGGTACGDCHPPQHGGLVMCGECHVTTAFRPASKFHHSDFFTLIGVHTTLACSKCHNNGEFASLKFPNTSGSWKCVDCHGTNHGGQTECANCHVPIAWSQTLPIVHPATNVPLGPSHAWPNPCSRCHANNNFSAPIVPCITCHGAGAGGGGQKIPHVGPTDCRSCHEPTAWADTHFTHASIQGSLLIPGYVGTSHDYTEFGGYPTGCAQCHTNPGPDFTAYSCIASGCHN